MSSRIASSSTLATSGHVTVACSRWPTAQRFGARSSVSWKRAIAGRMGKGRHSGLVA